MARSTITIVTPTLTGNALFRTDVIRRLLERSFDVEIVAYARPADRVYEPLADVPAYKGAVRFHATSMLRWRSLGKHLARAITGQVVVCIKPLMHSYGAALLASRYSARPIVLDIDDWEQGFLSSAPYWEMRSRGLQWLTAFDSPFYTRVLDGFVYKARVVTVSNSVLQGMYGGHWVPHSRRPQDFTGARLTSERSPVVFFGGAPRGHKGLATLFDAWKRLRHKSAVLRLAVPDPSVLKVEGLSRVQVTGPHRSSEVAELVRTANVVVVPQDNAPGSIGQLPIKLIDGMAAGCPIVATDVCDAARWLSDGAGLVVPPGAPGRMAAAIDYLLEHRDEAERMGQRAKVRYQELATEEVVGPRLEKLVQALIDSTPLPPAETAFGGT